ncbi:hypothetical protein ACEUB7_07505 [Aeromonas veronii]
MINDLGADSALDLAVSREALTKSIEKEITAVKLSDEAATDLAEVREKLLKELEKQSPVIDYQKDLNEQQLALLESLRRRTESNDQLAAANIDQADAITKQTAGIVKAAGQSAQAFKKVTKETTLLGNIAGKVYKSFTGIIGDKLESVLDEIPGVKQAKEVATFTKAVMPTKAKEKPAKRIQSVSKRDRMLPATTTPEKPQNAPESFTEMMKRRDEQGSGRNGRVMLKHLEQIDKTTGLILKEVKSSTVIGFVMKAMMASAVMGLSRLLLGLPATLAASLAKTIADKIRSPQPKPGSSSKKPDPAKPEPKKSDPKPKTDPAKTDSKKSDKPGTKTEPAKEPKPKADPKTQPKIEPGAKPDIPKPDSKPSSSPKPSSPAPAGNAGITKADKIKDTIKAGARNTAKAGSRGIPFAGTALFIYDVIEKQLADDRNVGFGHAQAIMAGEQDSYKGDYKPKPKPEPVKMDRGESSMAEQGIKISEELDKKELERRKEETKLQALMAQSYSSKATINQTTVNNVSGGAGAGAGAGAAYLTQFGNEYQTASQKGSMIQR